MNTEFLATDDARWSSFVARYPHDVFHTPEYMRHAARHEGGAACAVWGRGDEAEFLVPLLLRPIPDELGDGDLGLDATSPYGYPSPLCAGPGAAAEADSFFKQFREIADERQIVSVFLRLNPLLPLPVELSGCRDELVHRGPTVYIDLEQSADEQWSETRRDHRSGIRRLKRDGFHVTFDDWSLYGGFYEIYLSTMKRVAATPRYFFGASYFEDLWTMLGDEQLHLATAFSPAGEPASMALFTECSGIVQFLLSGTGNSFRKQAPSKLLLHETRQWFAERGNKVLHLGGGLAGAEDSLFLFKAGFSKQRAEFSTLQLVIAPKRYEALVDRWQEVNRQSTLQPNFFPAYRRTPKPDPSDARPVCP